MKTPKKYSAMNIKPFLVRDNLYFIRQASEALQAEVFNSLKGIEFLFAYSCLELFETLRKI